MYEFVSENPPGTVDSIILLEDGVAVDPALKFQNDLDTGIFRSGNNELSIATGGIQRFTVNDPDTVSYQRMREQSFYDTDYYATMNDTRQIKNDVLLRTLFQFQNALSAEGTSLTGSDQIVCMAYSDTLDRFVILPQDTNEVLYSNDSMNWVLGTNLPATTRLYYRVRWLNDRFIGMAISGQAVVYSTDGITWTTVSGLVVANRNYRDCIYLPSYGRYVLCNSSANNTDAIQISSDGINFTTVNVTQPSIASRNTIYSLAYSPELNILVGILANGVSTEKAIWSSDGGLNWTYSTVASSNALRDVVWSKELSLFVAVGDNAITIYSSDGKNWTQGTGLVSGAYFNVIWVPQLHIFVAMKQTVAEMSYSYNGKVWVTPFSIPGTTGTFTSLNWIERYGSFFYTSTGNGVVREKIFMTKLSNRLPTNYNTFNNRSVWSSEIGSGGTPSLINIDLTNEHTSYIFHGDFTASRVFVLPVMAPGQKHYIHFFSNQRASGTGGSVSIRFQQNAFNANDNQLITASVGTPFDLTLAQSNNLGFYWGSYYIHFPTFTDASNPTASYRVPVLIRLSQSNLSDRFSRILLQGGSASVPSLSFSQPETGTNSGIYNPANDELAFSTNSVERLKISGNFIDFNVKQRFNPTVFNANTVLTVATTLPYMIFDTTSSNLTLTLPSDVVGTNRLFQFYVTKVTANILTINCPSGHYINSVLNGTYTINDLGNFLITFDSLGGLFFWYISRVNTFNVSNDRDLVIPASGQLSVRQGSLTNPGIIFDSNQNYGIYNVQANDEINFKIAGSLLHKFTSTTSEITSQLKTRSIVNNLLKTTTGSNYTITRLNSLVYGHFTFDISGNITVNLPNDLTTADIGLRLTISKMNGAHQLTISPQTGNYLNNVLNGTVVLANSDYRWIDCILVDLVSSVEYWLIQH